MIPDFVGDVILLVLYISGFCFALSACCLISDYVLPQFPKAEKFLFRLFGLDPDDFEDDYEKEGGVQ